MAWPSSLQICSAQPGCSEARAPPRRSTRSSDSSGPTRLSTTTGAISGASSRALHQAVSTSTSTTSEGPSSGLASARSARSDGSRPADRSPTTIRRRRRPALRTFRSWLASGSRSVAFSSVTTQLASPATSSRRAAGSTRAVVESSSPRDRRRGHRERSGRVHRDDEWQQRRQDGRARRPSPGSRPSSTKRSGARYPRRSGRAARFPTRHGVGARQAAGSRVTASAGAASVACESTHAQLRRQAQAPCPEPHLVDSGRHCGWRDGGRTNSRVVHQR